ncbi:hypothetical protein F4813DRAFT_213456 [Daldinia decipiens]|uniref:uncharacterized protein n=1 Tax=Daldinia decipiens TaxID=326647 RepID=UPI0020C2E045|nr:uncharacterized protein F4813DRAFT_213456 [Daldinia decipiens]KAI1654329.1 hypothetical protein F4813DRAFT_213456 [Daldinia decipiens]
MLPSLLGLAASKFFFFDKSFFSLLYPYLRLSLLSYLSPLLERFSTFLPPFLVLLFQCLFPCPRLWWGKYSLLLVPQFLDRQTPNLFLRAYVMLMVFFFLTWQPSPHPTYTLNTPISVWHR